MKQGKVDTLLGIVFGDEGKGKVVDFFTPHYDVVARFAGGPNAGHTIIFDGKKFVLRSIPSGIFCEDKVNIIGNGCVIAPDLFMAEAKELNYDYDIKEDEEKWMRGIEYMRKFHLTDTEVELNTLLDEGKSVLAEGAQGTMLDIDHGTYPFVSSSSTTCGGVCTGLGVAPSRIGEVFGIFKAYSTRVGSGPFPVELFDETGDEIRKIGNEFGAVTGRNRRCGWIDLVALKYAVMVNGVTQLVMMKSDVLDGFDTIKACTAYELPNGEKTETMPFDTEGCKPIYTEIKGWKSNLTKVKSEAEFPQAFKDYIAFLEQQLQRPIKIVSVGPDREATIIR